MGVVLSELAALAPQRSNNIDDRSDVDGRSGSVVHGPTMVMLATEMALRCVLFWRIFERLRGGQTNIPPTHLSLLI